MFTCNIIIKIKEYFPKNENIPYENFTCVFTCGEYEFQIPLISKESEIFQYQMKNITSDIKYKVHVLDHNDMSLIGMCDMVISYDILNQLTPPNGFVQEQQKKLLMDPKTKRKLFGTVMNAGDIYLNIYSEIYLCKKSTITNNGINVKKKLKNANKKFDGSPRAIKKNQLLMQINSDRQAIMNKNNFATVPKNANTNNSGGYNNICSHSTNYNNSRTDDTKKNNINNIIINQNSSFNYRDNNISIKPKKNHINRSPDQNGSNFSKIKPLTKKNTKPNLSKKTKLEDNNNNYLSTKNNVVNRSDNNIEYASKNMTHPLKKAKSKSNKKIIRKNKNGNFNGLQYNNSVEKKITTIESLENIDHSGKQYITTKKIANANNVSEEFNFKIMNNTNNYNSAFTTNSTDQNLTEMDKAIIEKRGEITKIFHAQIKNNDLKSKINGIINETKINNNLNSNNNNNITQEEVKNNFINLIDFYSLLSEKLLKIQKKTNDLRKKSLIYKEKLFNELKKNNRLTQNKTVSEIENFVNIQNHGEIIEKYIRPMLKIKKSEFKVYQNIFNFYYYEYDIMKFKESEKNKIYNQQEKIRLLINVYQTLLKTYGNISQIYISNNTKKQNLKKCFAKYGVIEKNEGNENLVQLNENNTSQNEKVISDKVNNQNNLDNKFRVIKEEEEDEDEFEEDGDVQKSKYKESIGHSIEENKETKNIHKKIYSNISDNNISEDENKNIFIKKEKEETSNKKNINSNKKNDNNTMKDDNKENEQNNEQIKPKIINEEENIHPKKIIEENKNTEKKLLDDIIKIDEENNENNLAKENILKDEEQHEEKNMNEESESKEIPDQNKKQEIEDEEDLIMQKLLIEEFPKKCKEENLFIRINKYEYQFGKEIIKVDYEDGDVVLKLDEGDYKLEEFIEILNDGKENEENNENNEKQEEEKNDILIKNLEDTPVKNENSSNKKENSEEEKTKSRRRRHKITSSNEEEINNEKENCDLSDKESDKMEKNDENSEKNENNDNNCEDMKKDYAMKRRRKYYMNGK